MSTVTCRTDGCGSNGRPVPIELSWVDTDGQEQIVDTVVCGACGQQITDISDPPPPAEDVQA